jgi:hypothetical protein
MTLLCAQSVKMAVYTLRSGARHTQARFLVSDYYQDLYIYVRHG